MSMPLKTALIGALLFDAVVVIGICGGEALPVAVCQVGVVLVGATVAHLAELYLRRVYVEEARLSEVRWRLAERNEQLKAENDQLKKEKNELEKKIQQAKQELDSEMEKH